MIKKVILVTAFIIGVILVANYAQAESKPATAKSFSYYKRYACYPFTIRFPGFTCRTRFCSNSSLPNTISGYACGIRTVCRKARGRNYSCRW